MKQREKKLVFPRTLCGTIQALWMSSTDTTVYLRKLSLKLNARVEPFLECRLLFPLSIALTLSLSLSRRFIFSNCQKLHQASFCLVNEGIGFRLLFFYCFNSMFQS